MRRGQGLNKKQIPAAFVCVCVCVSGFVSRVFCFVSLRGKRFLDSFRDRGLWAEVALGGDGRAGGEVTEAILAPLAGVKGTRVCRVF